MSRVMEIVSADPIDIVGRRAHKAFRRIGGRVEEYDPSRFVEGRVSIEGYTAYLTVEWRPHRDGERVKVDVAASSNDQLSRAADAAMYRFLDVFKTITPEELDKRDPIVTPKTIALTTAGVIALAWLASKLLHHQP